MIVDQFSEIGFQVVNPQTNVTQLVSLDTHQCSCGEFRELMFPC
jgi:SWIM zinc finger